VLLFAVSVYFLVRPTCDGLRPTRSPNIAVLVTTLLLFLLVTLSWIIHFLALVLGILGKLNSIRMGTSLSAAQIALYIFQILLVDLIMVYRLYIVWDREIWICIFPALCWLATAVPSTMLTISQSNDNSADESVRGKKLVVITYCTSLALSLFCTVMISVRIWTVSRRVKSVAQKRSNLFRVIHIIVDSVTIYTAIYFAALVAYIFDRSGNVVLSLICCTGPVAGSAFCLIIIRVELSRIQDRDASGHLHDRSSTDGHSLPTRVRPPPNAIIINVTREEMKSDDYLEVGLDKYREKQSLTVTD